MVAKVDIEAAVPAILEAANNYRACCDDFDATLKATEERLGAAATAVIASVAMARQIGLDIGDPFDLADPVGRALSQIRLARYPIRLSVEI